MKQRQNNILFLYIIFISFYNIKCEVLILNKRFLSSHLSNVRYIVIAL